MIKLMELPGLRNLSVHESWTLCSEDYSFREWRDVHSPLEYLSLPLLHVILTDSSLDPCPITCSGLPNNNL